MADALRAVVRVGADLFKVSVVGHQSKGGGRRGVVTQFSEQSRRRMLELLAMVRLDFLDAFFVTLTYPGRYDADPLSWKRDLDVFLKRLRRRFPQVAGIWRLEFQRRGAPHYHLLIWRVGLHPLLFRRWVRDTWYEVVGSGDEKHLRAGTQCDRVETRRRAVGYVAKYAAKVGDVPVDADTGEIVHVGRWWGRFGDLPLDVVMKAEVTLDQLIELRRLAVAFLRSRGSRYARSLKRAPSDRGFSVFGLGDLSFEGWGSVLDSTAFRMLFSLVN